MEVKRREIITDKYYLPPEIWTQVLARVPVQTLLRMRCVCKSWLCIIDDPDFASLHLTLFNAARNRPRYLTLESSYSFVTRKTTQALHIRHLSVNKEGKFRKSAQIPILGKFLVIGCTKGLMLIERPRPRPRQLELWNPSTRSSLVIPIPSLPRRYCDWRFAFGFDPSSASHRDPDVKVVAIPLKYDEDLYLISVDTLAIYSLQSRSWRKKKVNGQLRDYKLYIEWKPLIQGEALHWLTGHYYEGSNFVGFHSTHLCSFHLGSEEFELVELPDFEQDYYHGEVVSRFPFLLGESMAIFGITRWRRCIWVMQKDGDGVSWTTAWYSTDPIPSNVHKRFRLTDCCPCLNELLFIKDTGTLLLTSEYTRVNSYNLANHEIKGLATSRGRKCVWLVDHRFKGLAMSRGLKCICVVAPCVGSLLLRNKFVTCSVSCPQN